MGEEAKVEVSIEASQNTGAFDVAAKNAENFGTKVRNAAKKAGEGKADVDALDSAVGELQSKFEQFLGIAAVEEFLRRSVQEALDASESYRHLGNELRAAGIAFTGAEERVRAFAETQEHLTRFAESDTVQAISKIVKVTGDLGQAMSAATLAENISSATGKELGESVSLVTNLLSGQQRGVMMARKEFAAYVGDTRDATTILRLLQKAYDGAAESEQSHAKNLAESRNEIRKSAEEIGTNLLPVVESLAKAGAIITRGWAGISVVISEQLQSAAISFKSFFGAFKAIITGHWADAKAIMDAGVQEMLRVEEAANAKIVAMDEATHAKRRDNIEKTHQLQARYSEEQIAKSEELAVKYLEATDRTYEAGKAAINKEIADLQRSGIQKFQIEENGVKKTITLEQLKNAQLKKLDEMRLQQAADTLQFISTLSNAKSRELVIIGKIAATAEAIINTHLAATKALAAFPPPINFGLAAAVELAGAAQVAAIAGVQLEEGGVVKGTQDGTKATIGEKGKTEAVLPLENARSMEIVGKAVAQALPQGGGLGGQTTINLSISCDVPEWRAIIDKLAEEASSGSPEIVTLARRLVDLASLNSRRSA
jgi:hypothetical protein